MLYMTIYIKKTIFAKGINLLEQLCPKQTVWKVDFSHALITQRNIQVFRQNLKKTINEYCLKNIIFIYLSLTSVKLFNSIKQQVRDSWILDEVEWSTTASNEEVSEECVRDTTECPYVSGFNIKVNRQPKTSVLSTSPWKFV